MWDEIYILIWIKRATSITKKEWLQKAVNTMALHDNWNILIAWEALEALPFILCQAINGF